tara:strand:+ start:114 stop:1376 length:1263 start_codon:yes stop_codon:yes gene_type:complete
MLKASGLAITRISISSVTLMFFYLFQYIGIPIYYFNLDQYRIIESNKYGMLSVFAGTSITITLLIFGFFAAKNHIGSVNYNLYSEEINTGFINKKRGIIINLIALFCLTIFCVYLTKVGFENIAFLNAISISDNQLGTSFSRNLMSTEFDGKYHWYSLVIHSIFSFLILIFFANLRNNKSFKARLSFLIYFPIVLLALLSTTEKILILDLFISLVFLNLIINYRGFIKPIRLIKFASTGLLVSFLLVSVLTGFQNIGAIVPSTVSRILTGSIEPALIYVETFPKENDYLLGKSLPNPGGLLPFEPKRSSVIVGDIQSINDNIQTTAPTAFWADAYANFGWIGVFTVPFFVGYIIYLIDRVFLGLSPNPLMVSLYVWVISHYKAISISSIGNYIIDLKFIGIVLVSIMIYGAIPKLKKIIK